MQQQGADHEHLIEVLVRSQAAGFLGPAPVEAHVDHAAAFAAAVDDEPGAFLDLGSGGGVPGLVLAVRWPSAEGVLVDGQLRRVRFLDEAIEGLGLAERVRAVHGRAEELARHPELRGRFDVVVARGFGPPGLTAECAVGFLRAGGLLLVSEPPDDDEGRWPAAPLASLGLVDEGIRRGGVRRAAVRRLRSTGAPAENVPRRSSAMQRRPAF